MFVSLSVILHINQPMARRSIPLLIVLYPYTVKEINNDAYWCLRVGFEKLTMEMTNTKKKNINTICNAELVEQSYKLKEGKQTVRPKGLYYISILTKDSGRT